MLEGLDSIDWASASHAYGDASDVPQLIRELLSTDSKTREAASQELFSNIWHQGTIYSATVHALPFLIDLLQFAETPDREMLALLVASIMDGHGYWEVHSSISFINPFTRKPIEPRTDVDQQLAAEARIVAEIRQIGARAVVTLLPYLKHSDSDLRTAIASALAHQIGMANAIVPALTDAFIAEPDSETRSVIGKALDDLAVRPA